ncbi:MAG: hypothetical protein AB7J35_02385 [Dehalococcoidia bacterium]
MQRTYRLKLFFPILASVLSVATLVVAILSTDGESRAAAPTLTYRLTMPLIGTDSVSSAAPQPTATGTATATPSPTASPTSTLTPTATATAAPAGQSAYLLVQSWYNHVSETLYGQYSAILANQSAGSISLNTAGNQLLAFKPTADAYKTFLDGQGGKLVAASAACNQARQSLALASGWLGLMAGWGGLILTGGGDYFTQRQEASDSYFSLMSQALGLIANCTGTASGTSTTPAPPTQTTVPAPTPTPTLPGGGLSGCFGTRTTSDWRLQVTAPQFSGDLFDVVVTPLTNEATDSSFKVRLYQPNLFSDDSSTKFFSFVGLGTRFHYGFDFFVSSPYPSGLYEVELRVDFLKETSLLVICP